jgi:hypothetical protein
MKSVFNKIVARTANPDTPWLTIQKKAVDEAKASLEPLVTKVRRQLPNVQAAQRRGAQCLAKFNNTYAGHGPGTGLPVPPCAAGVTELNQLVSERHTAVEEALTEYEGLSVRNVRDALNRWPTDPNLINSTVNAIRTTLNSALGKELAIDRAIAVVESAMAEDQAAA